MKIGDFRSENQRFEIADFQLHSSSLFIELISLFALHIFKVDLRAKSDSDFARLYVAGSQKALSTDGDNLVIINENTGAFFEAKAYDNFSGSAAVTNMTTSVCIALESLGSEKCRDVEEWDSWALIGVKGTQFGGGPEILVDHYKGKADIENYFFLCCIKPRTTSSSTETK